MKIGRSLVTILGRAKVNSLRERDFIMGLSISRTSVGNRSDEESPSVFLALPAELLVHIMSFLTTRDRVVLRYVSQRLRSLCEAPSAWTDFVWPHYHISDEGYVMHLLKRHGKYVKRLSFPDSMKGIASREPASSLTSSLVKVIGCCSNVVQLSLPSAELGSEKVRVILLPQLGALQRLDVQWSIAIEFLLKKVISLKELTVRVQKDYIDHSYDSSDSWLHFWMSKGFSPKNINIVTKSYPIFVRILWDSWAISNSKSLAGCTGHVKLYKSLKVPLNFRPIIPEFQLDFGQAVSSPFVKTNSLGLMELERDILLLSDGSYCGKVMHKASLQPFSSIIPREDQLNHSITSLKHVREFDASCCRFVSENLEQLAVVCPNLQRLTLKQNKQCLENLKGLHAIASSCHNLQGLNLMGIPVKEVGNQTQLWEILSDMKLTHLAVELCILLPSAIYNQRLIRAVKKCTGLKALETRYCSCPVVEKSSSLLSHFSTLIHCILTVNHHLANLLQDILTGCRELKYLKYTDNGIAGQFLSSVHTLHLQQLYIHSIYADLPNTFMSSVSTHGGLVHVVLNVRSMTTVGIRVLVASSPKLLTFIANLCYTETNEDNSVIVKLAELEATLKSMFSHRQLFILGRYTVVKKAIGIRLRQYYDSYEDELHFKTDLFSLWQHT